MISFFSPLLNNLAKLFSSFILCCELLLLPRGAICHMQGGQAVTTAECVYVWRVIPGLLCAAQVHFTNQSHTP